ncbi:hypothetical protein Tco_0918088, partial [Tanacetum coccineum]
ELIIEKAKKFMKDMYPADTPDFEKTTPEVLTMLRKIRDEIQGEIDFNKKTKDN